MFNPFKKTYSKDEKERISFLRSVKPFDKLSDDQLFIFLPYLYPRVYKHQEAVFFRKDPSQALYIVQSGDVSLNLDRDGEMEPLMNVKVGEAFGDNCFIRDSHRIYNAIVTSEEANLFVLPQGNILEIFESKPKIKALVLESLLTRYNDYTAKIFDAYKSSFGFFELNQAYASNS
jgi:CRP-like cAMP-binding protein